MRDDFSKLTIDRLAKRAGNVCSNPDCGKATSGAALGHDGFVNVGTASHITAAAPGGPRYDPNLTSEQRRHQSNGIWLCRTHGQLVDSDSAHFTVEKLREWKRVAEERSFYAIATTGTTHDQAIETAVAEAIDDELTEALRIPRRDSIESITSQLALAAKNDLNAFKRASSWPRHAIALSLRMTHGENVQEFPAPALATAIETFNEIVVSAPPGTGKTTTLLQVVEAILSRGNSVPAYVPLGEWSTQSDSLLQSIVRRHAFVGNGDEHLAALAHAGRLILALDGWNELDATSRQRARGEIKRLQRDFPSLGIIVSTRRQALDVPISGPVTEIDPLNEYQQMEIARFLLGPQGEALLDHARRTPGVRELVSVPLYLTTLLAHAKGDRLPASREEVLRVFVTEHERDCDKAEVLRDEMFGFHSEILTALAVEATRAGTASISDSRARTVIKREENRLIAEEQITGLPQPTALLDLLVSHHLLVRSGTDSGGISFQHQQFQEWYASFEVEDLMRKAAAGDADCELRLKLGPLNVRAWEESALFASERASRADDNGTRAVATAILETIGIDPMLTAEMIYRSSADVWDAIKEQVIEFAGRWHTSGTVDRAVRFMIMTGKPDFAPNIWPLISHENKQVYLRAFRAAYRFRPSVLGPDVEARIAELPESKRAVIASQIAFESGIEGMEMAARIASRDSSAKVKTLVIEALNFRHADRLVVPVLRAVLDEVWSVSARNSYPVAIEDADVAERLVGARERLIDNETGPLRRLGALLKAGRHGAKIGGAVAALIESQDFPAKERYAAWSINDAYKLFPTDVRTALLNRLQAGLEISSLSEDILRAGDIEIDDGPVVDFAMEQGKSESFIAGSLGILGPRTVGRLIDKLIALKCDPNKLECPDEEAVEQCHQLSGWITATRPSSFVKAILQRSSTLVPNEIGLMADLVSRHGKRDEGELLQIPGVLRADLIAALERWAEELLASPSSDRSQLTEVAMAIGRLRAPELGHVLGRLLAEDLARRRDAREKMSLAQEKREMVDLAVQSSAQFSYSLQYRRACAATGGEYVVELMKSYLPKVGFDGFGVDAAHVLRELWEQEHNSGSERRIVFGTDFSQVRIRRRERALASGGASSPFADGIFAVVNDLIEPGSSGEEHRHALQLAMVALRMPHGDRTRILDKLLQLPQSLREKQALLGALVLGGEIIRADMVLDGIKDLLAEWKTRRWAQLDQDWWEFEGWLELLPFSDNPMATLDGLELFDAAWRRPWRLRRILSALGNAPSTDAENVLKVLPRRDARFLGEHNWIGALERRSPMAAARTLFEFISDGAFSAAKVSDGWWFSRKLGGAMQEDGNFRAEVYRQYELAPDGVGRELLEAAISEAADEEGVLILVRNHVKQGKPFSGALERAIQHAAVGERPSPDWADAREVFGIAVPTLRKELFAMIESETLEAELAKKCLTRIDEVRDEYGPVESESRHPDIESGHPWPVPL